MAKTGEQRPAVRAPIYGRKFMAVTGHSSASVAALSAHQRGGNVVDAAISASAALTAVLGQATTIGGDCFALIHEASTGKLYGLNASGVAPLAATPDVFRNGMKVHGPLAAVVPGLVRGWEELHRKFGRLDWGELFQDATAIAEESPVSYILATRVEDARAELSADAGCAALYLRDGTAVAPGDMLRQPALAATLRRIARDGAGEFYTGETSRSIATAFERAGGLLTAADLAQYRPIWLDPISTDYRGHTVSVMPPNSCGGLLLMQLDGLSAVTSSELASDPGRRLGYQMSAMKAAFALGKPLITDASMQRDGIAKMLAPEMKARMRQAVSSNASTGKVIGSGGTACVIVADSDGNMICIVQSIYNVFGSAFMDPLTGILFNNRMQDFDHRPGQPGSVGPGRRPFHTLCPIMVHREGRPRFTLASPGGISQTLTGVQVLTELIDIGSDVSAAVEAPRWCNRKGGDFLIDKSFPPSIAEALSGMGHQARRGGDPYFFGSAKAIEWLSSGNLAGAGDHRREAFALGT